MQRLVIVAILIVGCWTNAPAREFTLANLKQNESLEIRFHSRGCFHHTKSRIRIRKADVYSAEVSAGGKSGAVTVELSSDDVAKIDQLITYYRGLKDPGNCTTEDEISLLWQGQTFKSFIEPFVDATCGAPEGRSGVMQRLIELAPRPGGWRPVIVTD